MSGRHRAADRGAASGEVRDCTNTRTNSHDYVPRHAASEQSNILIMTITNGELGE